MTGDLDDLGRAYALLESGGHAVVLCRGDDILTGAGRGVAPLVDWLSAGTDLAGFAAADRVVGRAAALLYIAGRVRAVHAVLASQPALDLLAAHSVTALADTVVPQILNRDRSAGCPMEAAVAGTSDPAQALDLLRLALETMRGGQS